MIKSSFFGEVDAPDGGVHLMDGGMHGVQGHTIEAPPRGPWRWERRLDGMQPRGKAGDGQLDPAEQERQQLFAWTESAWQLAPSGKADFFEFPPTVPRWVWCIVIRRGAEVRILQGGGVTWGSEPKELAPLLEWLRERVDQLSG